MDKPTAGVGAAQKIEKQARQLAYDTRYKVKQLMRATSGSKLDPASVTKAYVAQLNKSSASPAVKTRAKQMLMGNVKEEVVNSFDVKDLATDSVANALYRVFVEKTEVNIDDQIEELKEFYSKVNKKGERIYHIIVKDKKTGNTYTRDATREKIAELRANPNIASVEMSEVNRDAKKEKSRGANTASVKSGKGLDPVGQEDKDIDNDGDHDKTDKYLLNRRKVRGSAIAKRKGVAEEFIGEVTSEKVENEKIDVMKGKNKVVISPEVPGSKANSRSLQVAHYDVIGNLVSESEAKFVRLIREKAESEQQQKLFGLALSVKRGQTPRSEVSAEVLKIVDTMSEKKIRDFAKTKHEGLPKTVKESGYFPTPESQRADEAKYGLSGQTVKPRTVTTQAGAKMKPTTTKEAVEVNKGERDTRGDYAYRAMFKNKLRSAMGVKNPMVLADPEKLEKDFDKIATADNAKVACEEVDQPKKPSALDIVRASAEKQYGKGSIMTGKTKKPKVTAAQRKKAAETAAAHAKKTSEYLHSSPRD